MQKGCDKFKWEETNVDVKKQQQRQLGKCVTQQWTTGKGISEREDKSGKMT